MQFSFDPNKDAVNREKHGLSLADAPLVFNAADKLTLESPRGTEVCLMDLALVYVLPHSGEVRAISLRRASKQGRKLYDHWQKST